jgi:hypothetical protein
MKTPVIQSKDYTVYVEIVQGLIFIHMDVHRWTKEVKKQFTTDWLQWASEQNKPLYAMPFIDNLKMDKWVAMCGFKLFEMHQCTDGVIRKLYRWSK